MPTSRREFLKHLGIALTMSTKKRQILIHALEKAQECGSDLPELIELDIDIPIQSLEAARILVEVLLDKKAPSAQPRRPAPIVWATLKKTQNEYWIPNQQ